MPIASSFAAKIETLAEPVSAMATGATAKPTNASNNTANTVPDFGIKGKNDMLYFPSQSRT
ncbi:MAG: hypothetical protein COA85_05885 [Robiginitomaculum sp.]|nr:MAG: hypothetical protein COA85_05885 [Robiginitomaculum sp.]